MADNPEGDDIAGLIENQGGLVATVSRDEPGSPPAHRLDAFGPWVVLACYAALSLLFFLPALLPGRQIFGTDYLGSTFFWETFASSEFARGTLPAWLPTVYGGVPYFANPMDVYYPVSVLLRLLGLPVHTHLAWLFAVQVVVAGWGTYLLLKELGTTSLAAGVAGLAFMLNGALVSMIYGGHDNRMIVASLAPLTFFAVHRALRTGRAGWFVFLGVVLGAALLPFQIQSSYYLLLAAGLWFAFLLLHLRLVRPTRVLVSRMAGGVLALSIAFSLAAVNFVPFAGYVPHSPRGGAEGRGYDYAVSWSMPPEETAGLAVPERSGILQDYVGENPLKLHMEYAGALVLLLGLVGGYVLRGRRVAWFFPALGLFGLTLAYGGYTPLYRLYYAFLPGISRFRAPASAFFLVSLSLVVFAGLALDRLHRLSRTDPGERDDQTRELVQSGGVLGMLGAVIALGWALWATVSGGASLSGAPTGPDYVLGTWRFAGFAIVTALVLWLWSRDRLSAGTVGLLLAVLVTVDLWVLDRRFLFNEAEPTVLFAPDEVATFLIENSQGERIHVLDDILQDNYLTYFDLELVAGEHGNQLQIYNDFLGGSDSTYTDKRNLARPPFLALANAGFVVTSRPLDLPDLDLVPVFEGVHRGHDAVVYRNRDVLPRAFWVGDALYLPDPASLFARLGEPGFDPGSEVLLYGEDADAASPPQASSPGRPPPSPATTSDSTLQEPSPLQGSATVTVRTPTEVAVSVEAPANGFLVLTDTYHANWSATVDGSDEAVLRAFHTFRAVPVPAGRHEVVFRFHSRALRLGFAWTAATWVGLLLLGGYGLWRLASSPTGAHGGGNRQTHENQDRDEAEPGRPA
jgi:hypothetical protein